MCLATGRLTSGLPIELDSHAPRERSAGGGRRTYTGCTDRLEDGGAIGKRGRGPLSTQSRGGLIIRWCRSRSWAPFCFGLLPICTTHCHAAHQRASYWLSSRRRDVDHTSPNSNLRAYPRLGRAP